MDVCVLSQEEIGRLTHYGLNPSHDQHLHISSEEAIKGIKEDTFELVSIGPRQYVTRSKIYFLQRRPSGYIDTIQRVLSNHIVALKPVR